MKKLSVWLTLLCSITVLLFSGCGDDSGSSNGGTGTYVISGKVSITENGTTTGVSGVTITLDGDKKLATTSASDGSYSFTVPNGEYKITPKLSGKLFTPFDSNIAVEDTAISGLDFSLQPLLGGTSSNKWVQTDSMYYTRSDHTATLLPDGKVLLAGGAPKRSTAELYDPATGTSTKTGAMFDGRELFTATLLPNGKVLVTGGYVGVLQPFAQTELYDPATGTWAKTTPMNYGRSAHTATLLPNGKVLVTGGYASTDSRATAELYDPVTATWTKTGSLNYARSFHTATLLPDGKVLVAGGNDSNTYHASAELYDPATGTWTKTGSLSHGRINHTATLLPNGKVLVAGGNEYNGSTAGSENVELYDPATGTWAVTTSMNYARTLHTATLLLNGKILVAGGHATTDSRASAELYDPATGKWVATTAMNYARESFTATLLPGGGVLVAGGVDMTIGLPTARASVETFYPGL
jgi:hypothetical protein